MRLTKDVRRTFQVIWILLIILQTYSYGKNTGNNRDSLEKRNNIKIEIRVGTRTVVTDKYTKDGTPVVPMWIAPMATEEIRNGGGFQVLEEAKHTSIWKPGSIEEGAYNHYACLIHYKERFYVMWGNHQYGEDAPGQRVLYATSDEWGNWTAPRELFPAPGPVLPRKEKGIHLKPDRWAIIDDILYAITYVHGAGVYPIARAVNEDGRLGEPFLVQELPRKGMLPIFMEREKANVVPPVGTRLYEWYRENDQISWWANASWGVQRTSVEGKTLIESFIYRTKDGRLVLMLRDWGHSRNPVHNNRIYVSFNDGDGGWAKPYPTDIPDSPSRTQAITLDDGIVLLIGNQNVNRYDNALYLDRDPMTVSISKDGYLFDRVYALRTGSPTKHRFSDIGGRNPGYAYSSSIIHNGWLYTAYSIGKEDMGITRIHLSKMGL